MIERVTLFLTSAAMLCAASLPTAVPETVIVIKTEKPYPRMFTDCDPNMKTERERICKARLRSL